VFQKKRSYVYVVWRARKRAAKNAKIKRKHEIIYKKTRRSPMDGTKTYLDDDKAVRR
jgi:hypothetical protein